MAGCFGTERLTGPAERSWGLGTPTPTGANAISNGNASQADGLTTIAQVGNVAGPLCLFGTPGLTGGYFADWPGPGG